MSERFSTRDNVIWQLLMVFAISLAVSCSNLQEQLDEREVYEGPLSEMEDFELWYSDSAVVRLMLKAAKSEKFENGDQVYPEGIYIEYYGKDKVITSKLKADQAFYTKATDEWKAVGNVKLESLTKKQKLNTEELFWNVKDEQVYTEKFVIIETEEDVLHGEGLTAAQDFSSYRILKPTGELGLD